MQDLPEGMINSLLLADLAKRSLEAVGCIAGDAVHSRRVSQLLHVDVRQSVSVAGLRQRQVLPRDDLSSRRAVLRGLQRLVKGPLLLLLLPLRPLGPQRRAQPRGLSEHRPP